MNSTCKVILVTGTSRGIGKFLAGHYLRAGYKVIGLSRTPYQLRHPNYHHYEVDISQEEQVQKTIMDIDKKFGRLDILINNAGSASLNHALLTPLSTVNKLLAVNFLGNFLVSRESAKLMMKNRWGRIVNFSSVAVPLNLEGEAIYASTKSAVETLTKILAKELAKFNITCNAIGPSPIKTSLIKGVSEEKIKKILNALSIKRLAKFEDVTNVIDFFISENSSFITGQIIYLGGI